MNIANEILLHACTVFLCGTAALSLLLGVGLVAIPEQAIRFNHFFSRWINTDAVEIALDQPHWIEIFTNKHRRAIGSLLLIGSIVNFYSMLFSDKLRQAVGFLPQNLMWLWNTMPTLIIASGVLGAMVGLVMLMRPSLLTKMEKSPNRWISTDHILKYMNNNRPELDQYLLHHRKSVGCLMIVGGAYVMAILGYLLIHGA